jgi:hypothetical protein
MVDPDKILASAEAVREKWPKWGGRMKLAVAIGAILLFTLLTAFTGEHLASCRDAWIRSAPVTPRPVPSVVTSADAPSIPAPPASPPRLAMDPAGIPALIDAIT